MTVIYITVETMQWFTRHNKNFPKNLKVNRCQKYRDKLDKIAEQVQKCRSHSQLYN